MNSDSPTVLYPNPPYTQDELLSDASSDFPPIRVRESSPPQLKQVSSSNSPQWLRHSKWLNKGLGHRNVQNIVEATERNAKTSKRRRDLDTDGHHPSKKYLLAPIDTHDMEWLKGQMSDMRREIRDMKSENTDLKESIMGIGDYLKEEVGFILAEII